MGNKEKGSKAERELLKLFTEAGWRAARVAGSGVNRDSPCDLIAGKIKGKGFALEVKSSKKDRIYITKEQINDFVLFASMIGLKPTIALRFNREGWFFLNPKHLENSGNNWVVSMEKAREKGKRFGQFFGN
mgnify:CR=1 FL=1